MAAPLRLLSDDALVRLAAAGNRSAFAAIYERHSDSLLRYCRSISPDSEAAADAVQTTMEKALANLTKGSADSRPRQLRAWLFRVAHNESVSQLRRHRAESPASGEELLELVADTASAETRARLSELLGDLGELSERRRAALLMRELCGLSYEEIATALGSSEGAIRQSVSEARGSAHRPRRGPRGHLRLDPAQDLRRRPPSAARTARAGASEPL